MTLCKHSQVIAGASPWINSRNPGRLNSSLAVSLCLHCRVVKAAAADDIENTCVDVELTSHCSSPGNSVSDGDPQTVTNVSSSSDTVGDTTDEQQCVEGMEDSQRSLNTESTDYGDLSPLQADPEDGSPTTDNCYDAGSVESSTVANEVDTLATDDAGCDTVAVNASISSDADEVESVKQTTVVTDDTHDHNHLSSCNELSSSLTGSLDICDQGVSGTPDSGLVSAADSVADTATDSAVPIDKCTPTSCGCSGSSSAEGVVDDHAMESPAEPEFEDAETSQCRCDVNESDQSPAELENHPSLSESPQPQDDLEQSSVAFEKDLSVSATETCSVAADVSEIPSSNVHDRNTPALSPLVSAVSEITPDVEMEMEASEHSSPLIAATGVSSAVEPDCEHGGKASKLDEPTDADCSTSDDFESSDTGALHMSVGFQSTPGNDKVAAFDGDSRDTSIGVLMLCDDDGLISSVAAEPSAIMSDSSEAGFEESTSDGHLESAVAENSSLPFTVPLSGDEKRPSDVDGTASEQVDVNLTDSSEAVASEDVMLCEVESRSREMDDLLADVSRTIVNASHERQLSDTSIFSPEDSKLCYHLIIIIRRQFLTRRNTTKSLQGRASTQRLMTCHTVSRHISVRSCQWWRGKTST